MKRIEDLQADVRNILVNNGLTELSLGEPDELEDTNVHAAVPVSQLFFASPNPGASAPAIICEYTYGSVR